MECSGQLKYNSFTIVWFQLFSIEKEKFLSIEKYLKTHNFLKDYELLSKPVKKNELSSELQISPIDMDVFHGSFLNQGLLARYTLQGFNITITIRKKTVEL